MGTCTRLYPNQRTCRKDGWGYLRKNNLLLSYGDRQAEAARAPCSPSPDWTIGEKVLCWELWLSSCDYLYKKLTHGGGRTEKERGWFTLNPKDSGVSSREASCLHCMQINKERFCLLLTGSSVTYRWMHPNWWSHVERIICSGFPQ